MKNGILDVCEYERNEAKLGLLRLGNYSPSLREAFRIWRHSGVNLPTINPPCRVLLYTE